MTRKLRVYVSAPYTHPCPDANTQAAIKAGHALLDAGFVPFVPHLWHFMELQRSRPYEEWMHLDFAWLEQCDVVLRLPGVSPGADREVAWAERRGIRVFQSLEELVDCRRAWQAYLNGGVHV